MRLPGCLRHDSSTAASPHIGTNQATPPCACTAPPGPALQYNGEQHPITKDAEAARRAFETHWMAAGLTLDGQMAAAAAQEGPAPRAAAPPQQQQGYYQQQQHHQAQGWQQQAGAAAPAAYRPQVQVQQVAPRPAAAFYPEAAAAPPTGAAAILAGDATLQALLLSLPPDKQQQVQELLKVLPADQVAQVRQLLQQLAGQAAAAAPQAAQQAQQQGYYQQQQAQAQQQVQAPYGYQAPAQAQAQAQQGFAYQQPAQQAQQAQQGYYQQQAQQQAPAPAQQWGAAAPAQAQGGGGWQQLQQQQAAPAAPAPPHPAQAPSWQTMARQLLEGLARLPASAHFLQPLPSYYPVSGCWGEERTCAASLGPGWAGCGCHAEAAWPPAARHPPARTSLPPLMAQPTKISAALQGMEPGMDLNAVAQKLAAGAYRRPLDMAADVSHTLNGAAAYPEGSEVRQAAQQVQAMFEGLWRSLMAPYSNL